MKKTETFFLIHNYNTVPKELIELCSDYLIIDCSDDGKTKEELKASGYKFVDTENTGHNLTSYFHYFIDHYDELPEWIALLKGNIIGRHVSREYFERVCDNKWFTFLYQDQKMWERYKKGGDEGSIASLLSEGGYIEHNSSWYMNQSHAYRYFYDMDDFYRFVYKDPVIPRECMFSPGGCYIVNKAQILKNSKTFYKNLNTLMEYRKEVNFPAEAFLVERMLPWIFTSRYEVNPWMEDEAAFKEMLKKCEISVNKHREWEAKRLKRFRKMLGAKPPVFLE
ncbi:MAG: DUF3431 domain-containing protein [Butyrivibrio sp.]|nr:DUF3431 domain-containing protein [Butyrivibrio sp.]